MFVTTPLPSGVEAAAIPVGGWCWHPPERCHTRYVVTCFTSKWPAGPCRTTGGCWLEPGLQGCARLFQQCCVCTRREAPRDGTWARILRSAPCIFEPLSGQHVTSSKTFFSPFADPHHQFAVLNAACGAVSPPPTRPWAFSVGWGCAATAASPRRAAVGGGGALAEKARSAA